MLEVSICVGSSCHLKGSYQILKVYEALIKAKKLEDKVELKAAFCLGHCTKGVAIKVGDAYVDGLTVSNADEVFKEYIEKKVQV